MIHQELLPVYDRNVAENIYLGHETYSKITGYVNDKKMLKECEKLLNTLEIYISPKSTLRTLSIANIQLVEIAKAVANNAPLLIMDEPTSSLTIAEINNLEKIMRRLKHDGIMILFISHKLEEIYKFADNVTILRDGKHIRTSKVKDINSDELINCIVGRTIEDFYPKHNVEIGKTVLEVRNFSKKGTFENISFGVNPYS